ncbi:NAD(P)H-binding protein [Kitasatospora sp. NBC_00240]|uniref:SDR family oxidoreductase n=1 Tax=Kitasatospora sp. NBC_00240 TaxID=2903567 RepID=UPI00224F6B04|nr:NAD(P)H-binding protein [Kitasatospora sp. NBC_00240]MCX5210528.1 NAD(P)H-binding protein [Kitasatospora sp. NBC_00240]
MTKPILVTGGTGTLGREVVRLLLARGCEVRVLSRREHSGGGHAWVVGDLATGAGVDAAVAGVAAVVDCATTQGKADVTATANLVAAARRAMVPHLVYISIVGVDRVPLGYYRAKLAAERLVRESGLGWTVLRATQFHDLLLSVLRVTAKSPVVPVAAGVRFQPVDVREVAARLVELVGGEPAGYAPELGGPRVIGYEELARAYLRAAGLRRVLLPVRLPGETFRRLRAGGNLTPEHADGRGTFEEALAERFGGSA